MTAESISTFILVLPTSSRSHDAQPPVVVALNLGRIEFRGVDGNVLKK
jgi:hypothetical protein